MYWTVELITQLSDAPFPATKTELLEYAERSGLSAQVVENLRALEDDDEIVYDSIEEIWPDSPTRSDYFFNEDEY